jgi:pimeloyl-ACP methyl ester carboxylesterase
MRRTAHFPERPGPEGGQISAMKNRSALFVPALVICAALLSSCVANVQYRHGADEDSLKNEHGINHKLGVSVNVIEIDEHGEFWDRKQLNFALGTIFKNQDPQVGEIVVTFVHGWKNNASPENAQSGNLHQFTEVLNRLADKERALHPSRPRNIVGIYIAWRGSSVSTPILKELTFYSRMNAATRIGNSPAATEALLYILGQARDNKKTKSIVIGHSYGGLFVEKALAQALVETAVSRGIFKKSSPTGVHPLSPVRFPADLVVLVNPAAPGIYARELSASLEAAHVQTGVLNPIYACGRTGVSRPIIVSMTSEGDWGTGFFFPLGNRITSVFQRFDKPTIGKNDSDYPPALRGVESQRFYYTHTEGNIDELLTHRVRHSPRSTEKEEGEASICSAFSCSSNDESPASICYEKGKSRFILTPDPKPTVDPSSAYWIMRIPKTIVANHTDVFVDPFVDMLSGLIDVTNATSYENSPETPCTNDED